MQNSLFSSTFEGFYLQAFVAWKSISFTEIPRISFDFDISESSDKTISAEDFH